jgi:hypothetical protein
MKSKEVTENKSNLKKLICSNGKKTCEFYFEETKFGLSNVLSILWSIFVYMIDIGTDITLALIYYHYDNQW